MDNKKIVSVAVLAVLALAFAGYGYAEYTASTYNEGNEVLVNYIKVTPSQWTAITDVNEIDVDTYTYNGDYDVLYKLANNNMVPDENNYVQIGADYILTIDGPGVENFEEYKIDITIQGELDNDGTNFYLVLDCNGETKTLADTLSFTVDSTTATFKLLMYVEYDAEIDFPNATGWDKIEGATVGPSADGPLLTGLEGVTDVPEDTPAGAIFIFKVSGVPDNANPSDP